ncbi:MAG: hypothetical protein D4R44_02460 [Actinobacteria bacterium]|nr:MAG: hypothetical protein D4R44_02460 [Actinomycetota bacterium]
MLNIRTYLWLIGAVIVRPHLWSTAVVQGWRLVPRQWWKSELRLPLPARAYVDFRMTTQYGDGAHQPEIGDIIDYLEWSKDWRSTDTSMRRRHRAR